MFLILVFLFLYFLGLWVFPDSIWLMTKIILVITSIYLLVVAAKKKKFFLLIRRFLDSILTISVIAVFCFILVRLIPGNPFAFEELSPEINQQLNQQYHLDLPVLSQLKQNLLSLLKGDLGHSLVNGRSVSLILSYYLPRSLQLGFISFTFCILLSVFLTSIKVFMIRPNSRAETIFNFFVSSQMAFPSFLAASLLSYMFAYKLSWLPMGLWLGPEHYILPALSLCLRPASILTEFLTNSIEHELGLNYVQALKAKGVGKFSVIFKHIFPTASLSVLGYIGPLASSLLTGSFIVEYMFAIPGVGSLMIESVLNRDYPVVVVMTVVFCIVLQLFNFLSDCFSEFLNPQVEAI